LSFYIDWLDLSKSSVLSFGGSEGMFLSSEHIFVNKLRETDNTIEHNGCARLIFQKKAKSSTFFDLIVVHVRFLRILL